MKCLIADSDFQRDLDLWGEGGPVNPFFMASGSCCVSLAEVCVAPHLLSGEQGEAGGSTMSQLCACSNPLHSSLPVFGNHVHSSCILASLQNRNFCPLEGSRKKLVPMPLPALQWEGMTSLPPFTGEVLSGRLSFQAGCTGVGALCHCGCFPVGKTFGSQLRVQRARSLSPEFTGSRQAAHPHASGPYPQVCPRGGPDSVKVVPFEGHLVAGAV